MTQWMPMYWGDYLRDTQHLSTIEHGAYLLLIAHYWNTGEALPVDDERLRRITRTSNREWKLMAKTIREFFSERDGKLHHTRIDEELKTSSEISARQSTKSKQRKNIQQNQGNLFSHGSSAVEPYHNHNHSIEEDKSSPIQNGVNDAFEEFWAGWIPFEMSKGSKQAALKSYQKTRKEIPHETLIRSRDQYLENCRAIRCKTKHVATWLNQRGWESDDALGPISTGGECGFPPHGKTRRPTALELAMADKTRRWSDDGSP